jgi:small conductance mechanosensitive channel
MILVETLARSTVNLRVYFWLNGRQYSWMKVRSSIIRLVKQTLQQQGFSMPPSVVQEIAVRQGPPTALDGKPPASQDALTEKNQPEEPTEETPDEVSTKAEAGLYSEAVVIEEQARQAQPLKDEENLLSAAPAVSSSREQPKKPKV